jgi:DNA replication protein DnaC
MSKEERFEKRKIQWESDEFKNVLQQFPKRIQTDLTNIPFPNLVVRSSYFHGKTGSGKTIKAIQMMITYVRDNYYDMQSVTYGYASVPELLLQFRSRFNSVKEKSSTESELVDFYSNLDFLILDDFGVEKTSEWAFQMLYIIINRRYDNEKLTVFTSNLDLVQLSNQLGDERLTGRINQMCDVVQTKDINYRES